MNERIKQLAEQAIHYAASRPMPELKDRDLYLDNLFEKFAELIIREYSYDVMNLTSMPKHVEIAAKHWGVEL
jgi:hypothetical protein